jgi:hypothetical protein
VSDKTEDLRAAEQRAEEIRAGVKMAQFTTKDSGQRAEYSTGMVRDLSKDKPRFDLITPLGIPYDKQMLTRWAMLMTRGARKYGDRNWEQARTSEEYDRAMESAFRHFMQWYFAVDDGEDHAAAVMFNITEAEFIRERVSQ